jgi:catechol 2,3-dioxygenase-like lactoylglutathione lyase family enzyme
MRKTYNAVFILLLFLLALPSFAQDEDPVVANKRQLMQFAANNDAFDKVITDMARVLYRRQVAECGDIDQAVRQLPTPYGALSFPANAARKFAAPDSGLWVEHVKIRGCARIWQINILAVGQKDLQQPLLLALLPGETLSDPGAQGNAIHMAAVAIRHADATCADDAKAYYTRMLGFKQPDGTMGKADDGQGWFEEWLFKFCGKTVPAQVAFIPDGAGGFDIKTRIVGETPVATPVSKPAQETQQIPATSATPITQQTPAVDSPAPPAE